MIPVNIQDLVRNTTDTSQSVYRRQFYYDTLVKIHQASGIAIAAYERELEGRKN